MIKEFRNTPDDDDTLFRGYKIITTNDKYGIIKLPGQVIIEPIFNYITWYKEDNLVQFQLDGKYAICRFDDLQNF